MAPFSQFLNVDITKNDVKLNNLSAAKNVDSIDLKDAVLVQVVKSYNVAQPKINQHYSMPRLLKLTLSTSDGEKFTAFEFFPIFNKSTVTPGSKLELKGRIEIVSGNLLLSPTNARFLGEDFLFVT